MACCMHPRPQATASTTAAELRALQAQFEEAISDRQRETEALLGSLREVVAERSIAGREVRECQELGEKAGVTWGCGEAGPLDTALAWAPGTETGVGGGRPGGAWGQAAGKCRAALHGPDTGPRSPRMVSWVGKVLAGRQERPQLVQVELGRQAESGGVPEAGSRGLSTAGGGEGRGAWDRGWGRASGAQVGPAGTRRLEHPGQLAKTGRRR